MKDKQLCQHTSSKIWDRVQKADERRCVAYGSELETWCE